MLQLLTRLQHLLQPKQRLMPELPDPHTRSSLEQLLSMAELRGAKRSTCAHEAWAGAICPAGPPAQLA